jgi:hypothetical protein
VIVLAGKQRFRFQVRDVRFRCIQLAIQVFQQIVPLLRVGFFLGQIYICFDVFGQRRQLVVRGDLIFRALAIAQYGLGSFLIAPEVGVGDALFEGFYSFTILRCVKDNSARA